MTGKPRRFFGRNPIREESETRSGIRSSHIPNTFENIPAAHSNKPSPSTYLRRNGDTMNGTFALGPIQDLTIVANKLVIDSDLTLGTIQKRSVVRPSPQSGTTDDLENITGGIFETELLYLIGTAGNTITIKHNFGGNGTILCPGDTDYTLSGDEIVCLMQTDNTATSKVWRIVGDSVVGGGGGVNFPIEPAITDEGNTTGAKTIDLSSGDGHVYKVTLTGDVTLSFSNYPTSGDQREWEIEWVQNGTGGHTVTHPSEVVETVGLDTTPSTTTIITYRTNDGGTTVHAIPALRGTISLGNNGFATVALDNLSSPTLNTSIDVNLKDLNNIDRAKFVSSTGTSATDANIAVNSGDTKLVFNVPTGYEWSFTENNVQKWTLSPTTLTGANYVASNTVLISDSSTDPTVDGVFTVNGTDVKVYSGGAVRNLSNVGSAGSQIILADTEVTITDVGAGNIVGKVDNIQQFSVSASSFSIDNDVNLGAFSTDTITFNGGADSDLRMEGNAIVLDADEDTKIEAATDDVIKFYTNNVVSWDMLQGTLIGTFATAPVNLVLDRDAATPNDDDVLGRLRFQGETSAGSDLFYAQIKGVSKDVTLSSLDGEIIFDIYANTQQTEMFRFGPESASSTTTALDMYEDQTPGNGDVGEIRFFGNNNAGTPQKKQFAQIKARIEDMTSGSEDGGLLLRVAEADTMRTVFQIKAESGSTQLGFFNTTAVSQQTSTNTTPTADLTYSSNERDMIQDMWDALVAYGLLNETP